MSDCPTSLVPPAGGVRGTLEASSRSAGDARAVLALVLETQGSTYVRAGAMALFGGDEGQVGWLSGGCIESDIAQCAQQAAAAGRVEWMDIDTRHDEDLLSGSAPGCRGRLRLALLPLARLTDWSALVHAWLRGEGSLQLRLDSAGDWSLNVGTHRHDLTLPVAPLSWSSAVQQWRLAIAPPPSIVVFGAGPESPTLLPVLRMLGCVTCLVEQRPRWRALAGLADRAIVCAPARATAALAAPLDAALVMHHNFELDREALHALADTPVSFIGLLGPLRRREDLFRVLPAKARDALLPRLHSPVGLPLGGDGPEAIALSIAAQLQCHLHDTSLSLNVPGMHSRDDLERLLSPRRKARQEKL